MCHTKLLTNVFVSEHSNFGTTGDDDGRKARGGDMSVLLLNIRSLRRNFKEFMARLVSEDFRPNIIVLVETWIFTHESAAYGIDGYVGYFNCQERTMAGGVAVFVDESYNSFHVGNYNNNVEACIVGIRLGGKTVDVIGSYRSPTPQVSNLRVFVEEDMDQILKMSKKNHECIWTGDLNVDILQPTNIAEEYMSKLAAYGLQNVSTGATRRGPMVSTAIDHLYYRERRVVKVSTEIIDARGISDHDMIRCEIQQDSEEPENFGVEPGRVDWIRFSKELKKLNVGNYLNEADPDKLTETLLIDIEDCRRKATKRRENTRKNTPLKPWISRSILQEMRERDKAWQRQKDDPTNPSLREQYRRKRNAVRQKLRDAEVTYLQKRINLYDDPKGAWRVINEQLRGKRCIRKLPAALSGQKPEIGEMNRANEFITETGKRANEKVGYVDNAEELPSYTVTRILSEFSPPSILQTTELIKALKNGKAPGEDGFHAQTLKKHLDFFVPVLTHLIETIYMSGKYPERLKRAHTIIIHKKGDTEQIGNYRPISLLSIFNKVIEKHMAREIEFHFRLNKIISDRQFGFRRRKGTQDAILELQKHALESLDKELIPVALMIDYTSAFDSIPHRRLIQKLQRMGITEKALQLTRNYLCGRSQRLRCGAAVSEPSEVICGVPQGGSLSAVLFIAYINDLLMLKNDQVDYIGYADDTCLLFSFKDEIDKRFMETETRKVMRWSMMNGMLLNAEKSCFMVFNLRNSARRSSIKAHNYNCDSELDCDCGQISNVQEAKYLGVTIDEHLSWKPHLTNLIRKLRSAAVTIGKLNSCVDRKTVTIAYKAIFESQLRYGILAYYSCFQNNIRMIESIQDNVIRQITKAESHEKVEPLYDKAGILPLRGLYFHTLLMECIVRNPDTARTLVENLSPDHDYSMRKTVIRSPHVRLVRSDRYYMNRYLKTYRENQNEIQAVVAAKKISQKKSEIRALARYLSSPEKCF